MALRCLPSLFRVGAPYRPIHNVRSAIHQTTGASMTTTARTIGLVVVASTSLLGLSLRTTANQSSSSRKRAIPSHFGSSIRQKHDLPLPATDDREDCPICRKFSQGPCGTIFQQWLKCTDAHPGEHPETKVELHVEKCSHLATPLSECLQKHKSFYEKLSITDEENDAALSEEERDLKEAWENVIQEVESTKRKKIFPDSMKPHLQIRPYTGTGMAAFPLDFEGHPLLMAYVKDDATGEVLAAGAHEDLYEWKDNMGVLRLAIPKDTLSLTAYALYETDDKKDIVLMHTERVPPRPKD